MARARAPAPVLPCGDISVDVVVVGAGIVGTVAACLLKERGHKVALLDSGNAGHGVTGRSTAKVTAQHSTYLQRIERDHGPAAARTYAAANLAGVKLVADLARKYGLACDLERADSFVYALSDEGVSILEAERAAGNRAGLPMDMVQQTELPFPVEAALRLKDQYQFQPADFVGQLAAIVSGEGSFVLETCPVLDWTESRVVTKNGAIMGRCVIMATHLPLGRVGQFHAKTRPHMHPVLVVPVEPERVPAGMYISVDEPKRSLRSHRCRDGRTMLILSGPTYKHGNATAEMSALAELDAFAREHFGYSGGGYRWTNEDYTPRDGLPYVGWSGEAGRSLLVATGFDAWGLSNGAAAALILADLCDGQTNEWHSSFDASRHSLGGLGGLVSNASGVARDLLSGHLRNDPQLSSDAREGSIIDVEGRSAGIYRSQAGDLRAVSAVCTHMGCTLGWNPVDRTWDCPCHGSRFSADGLVTHGPATEPLSRISLSTVQEAEE
jgi:glycine/D-amino acid oxidase-like deaminating enzyme/nitrite reductase/ring-hydroxylating ferredoxin subunit